MRDMFLVLLLVSPSGFCWDKQELQNEVKEYRGELQEEFIELKEKEKKLVRVIKYWKKQKLADLKADRDQDLRLLNQEFSIKLDALNAVQRYKTKHHQKMVEKTFIRSIELKEEKFKRKRDIFDEYLTAVAEVEKQYMDKYHNIVKEYALKRKSNLNNHHPGFFPELTEVRRNPWLNKTFCQQQVFYRKQQAKIDHKTYLFDLTVPIRKKREEAQMRYQLAKDELAFYHETHLSVVELAKVIKGKGSLVGEYSKKLKQAKKQFYLAENEFNRLKTTIKQIAHNLKQEKSRERIQCDPTQPIAKIRINE